MRIKHLPDSTDGFGHACHSAGNFPTPSMDELIP
jgi:hypothetical protein